MRLTKLAALLLLKLGLVHAVAILYPDGYVPTDEEHAANVVRAENPRLSAREDTSAVDLSAADESSALATTCIRAHCGYEGSVTTLVRNIQWEIFDKDDYIFYLSSGGISETTVRTWSGRDHRGQTWVFSSEGQCGSFAFRKGQEPAFNLRKDGSTDTIQDDCPAGQWQFKCTLKEATYKLNLLGACDSYPALRKCDFRGYCYDSLSTTNTCWTDGKCTKYN